MMYSTSSERPARAFLRSVRLRFSRITFSHDTQKRLMLGVHQVSHFGRCVTNGTHGGNGLLGR
jgi:hypothetical protein